MLERPLMIGGQKSEPPLEKSPDAFRTISEVSEDLDLPQHVLRFWETRFSQIKPLKRAGARRYYRPSDIVLLRAVRQLLYDEGYTIKGVQRLLKEQGAKGLGLTAELTAQIEPTFEPTLDGPVEAPVPRVGADTASRGDLAPEAHLLREALAQVDECVAILDAVRPNRS